MASDCLLPGQPIRLPRGPLPQLGGGIYSKDGHVRASLVGIPHHDASTLAISHVRPHPPAPNSTVLGSVTRLSPQQAMVSITIVDGVPLPAGEEFTGVIRVQDVRATEKDKVKIGDCFRGGDVVKGLVISLGDARSYYLTTARNDLGVIFATSEAGATMEPVSWQEMRCPKTGKIERRKCAKPEEWSAATSTQLYRSPKETCLSPLEPRFSLRSGLCFLSPGTMTAVLSATDALRKENMMASLDDQLNYASSTDWKSKYYEVAEMLSETRNELDDFHQSSKELEEELERELQRTEKAQQNLKVKVERAESERDEWKSKFVSLQTTHNKTTTSLQREIDTLRQDHQKIKVQLRELEMGNDDLERTERAISSSLADVETKYSRALEEKILLEHELLDKANMEEECQRFKDELRDANAEISVLKDQIQTIQARASNVTLNSEASSSRSTFLQNGPQKSDDDLLHTQLPSDLQLSDLSPESNSPSPTTATPRPLTSPLNKDAGQSALLRKAGFASRAKLSTTQASPFSSRSTTVPSLSSPTRAPPRTALTRPSPRTPMSPISSNTVNSIPTIVSKNRGVQMVSEMRARVKNLEQKIHTRVPRLRMGSTSTRPPSGSATSILSSKPPSIVSSATSSNSSLQPRTSDERIRPSILSRRGEESAEKKQTPRRDSTGWVLIMEDSPTPLKSKEKEARKMTSATSATNVPSYRPYVSAGPDSPSRKPREPRRESKEAMSRSTMLSFKRPTSQTSTSTEGRSSVGTTATISSLATPVSRPTTPTSIPVPSSGLYSGTGTKHSTGPGSGTYSSNGLKRSSLEFSTTGSPTVFNHLSDSVYHHRERPTSVPAPPRVSLEKSSPSAYRSPSIYRSPPNLLSSNLTVRASPRLPPGNMTSLSQSRIAKPNFGASGRRSSGEDSDLEAILGGFDRNRMRSSTLAASTNRRV
ncbi:hypothetical protein EW146_g594 [Bondarzewia mesenterica]|uniref:S1 motif domain-containing protein n=1 Tax=Bondarzewia mesenterica TaxID=1095465 RepID=A0A4S4M6D5_9AGAM|nr:hypothetical protein EW146_g594 [Bondarzewia mesenterica]